MDKFTFEDLMNAYAKERRLHKHTIWQSKYYLCKRLEWWQRSINTLTLEALTVRHKVLKEQAAKEHELNSWADAPIALVRKLMIFAGDEAFRPIQKQADKMQKLSKLKRCAAAPHPSKGTLAELLREYSKARGLSTPTENNYVCRLKNTGWRDKVIEEIDEHALACKIDEIRESAVTSGKSDIWTYQTCKMIYSLVDFAYSKGRVKFKPARHWKEPKATISKSTTAMPPTLPRIPRQLATTGITFGELSQAYLDHHAKVHCRSANKIESYFKHFSELNDVIAANISRLEVQALLGKLGNENGKTHANRAVELIKTIFNKAIEWEIFEGKNPAAGVKLFRLQSRDRFLDTEEIQRLITAASTLRYETTRDFLLMCLFTAARRSNVAAMRWDEISFETKIWSIPLTKNGTPQKLPLTDAAFDVLMRRKQNEIGEFVFPSDRSKCGHLTKPEGAWYALLERADLKDVRLHDLRRSMASWQAMTGANLSVIMNTLNHKDTKSAMIYARLQVEPVRDAMNIATTKMLSGFDKSVAILENAQ